MKSLRFSSLSSEVDTLRRVRKRLHNNTDLGRVVRRTCPQEITCTHNPDTAPASHVPPRLSKRNQAAVLIRHHQMLP